MDQSEDNRVQLLPPDLASQIAAGEVVERPASALKELLENSVDAGATRCTIEIEGGGISRISVLDDGLGMSRDDAERALQRHATSKLREFRDLEALTSYGFRGEALPSIASVSKFILRTRRECDAEGVELHTKGSLTPSVQPVGCAVGTFIEVRDLFFNVPARRKFLRSTGTESGHLTDVVDNLALARPALALTLRRDGRQNRSFHRASSREERARQYFDMDLLACRGTRGPIAVEAYLSRAHQARSGAQGLRLLINNRPIRDRSLAVAAAQAYGPALERGQYPRGVIYLDLPPSLVDFNVHPQKLELRFAEPRAVNDAVYRLLREALAEPLRTLPSAGAGPTPPRDGQSKPQAPSPPTAKELIARDPPAGRARGHWQRGETKGSGRPPPSLSRGLSSTPHRSSPQPPPAPHSSTTNGLLFLAQTRHGYLVCETESGLCLVDPHAATELIVMGQLESQLRAGAVERQTLLFPIEVLLAEQEANHAEQHLTEFAAIGMKLIRRNAEHVILHSVPRVLQHVAADRLLQDVIRSTMSSSTMSSSGASERSFADRVRAVLAPFACQAAVPRCRTFSREQAEAMLATLACVKVEASCLHSAAIIPLASWADLEQRH